MSDSRGRRLPGSRSVRPATVARALGAAIGIVALVVSVAGPPVDILSVPRATGRPAVPEAPTAGYTSYSGTTTPALTGQLPGWLVTLIQLALLAIAAVGVYLVVLLVRYAVSALRVRTRMRDPGPAPVSVDPLPEVPEPLGGDAAIARRQLLLAGEPRNAIVACWLDLEESAAAAGLPRRPAETSTEWLSRVLATWAVDEHAIARLAALYREARFSVHALGEPERAQALAHLDRLHTDLLAAHPLARSDEVDVAAAPTWSTTGSP